MIKHKKVPEENKNDFGSKEGKQNSRVNEGKIQRNGCHSRNFLFCIWPGYRGCGIILTLRVTLYFRLSRRVQPANRGEPLRASAYFRPTTTEGKFQQYARGRYLERTFFRKREKKRKGRKEKNRTPWNCKISYREILTVYAASFP